MKKFHHEELYGPRARSRESRGRAEFAHSFDAARRWRTVEEWKSGRAQERRNVSSGWAAEEENNCSVFHASILYFRIHSCSPLPPTQKAEHAGALPLDTKKLRVIRATEDVTHTGNPH
ncbi:hypothetical protein ACMFMG_007019 [Clarireedia jacksonii]